VGIGSGQRIHVKVSQYLDGAVFNGFAAVSVAGTTRSASGEDTTSIGTVGGWVAEESIWDVNAGFDASQVTITSQQNGSLIDKLVVEVDSLATTPVTLTIRTLAGGGLELSWPSSAGNYNVDWASDLTAPINWQPLGGTAQVSGDRYVINTDAGAAARFFRLRK